ncbi:hypothetical protein T10_10641 [Trichinella papuae]|uniref:Uncharacterized protein n=1 Tax=Trichinella papuae TaxID=268474 RepID=A0A0V1MWF1_9BILA|nr:hypothetical protein T10_10641 [Trichinella papuae]
MVTTSIFRLPEWTKHSVFLPHRNKYNPTCISSLLYFKKTAERISFVRNRCICAYYKRDLKVIHYTSLHQLQKKRYLKIKATEKRKD